MNESFTYPGDELVLFQHATNWKKYFSRQIKPYIKGDVLEVGAGIGAMAFTIVPTRGFEVWKAQAGKLRLGWDSPVREIIHPSYIRLADNGGQGWVAGFGGLMVRGGLWMLYLLFVAIDYLYHLIVNPLLFRLSE